MRKNIFQFVAVPKKTTLLLLGCIVLVILLSMILIGSHDLAVRIAVIVAFFIAACEFIRNKLRGEDAHGSLTLLIVMSILIFY